METKTIVSVDEVGAMYGLVFKRFDPEKHQDWKVRYVSESEYTLKRDLSQRIAIVKRHFTVEEWTEWHEPQIAPVSPPDAPEKPVREWRAPNLPLGEIVGVLWTITRVVGSFMVNIIFLDPVLVAKIDGEYWSIAEWLEIS